MLKDDISRLMEEQLAEWREFAERVALMRQQGERRPHCGNKIVTVRDNPARLVSTTTLVTMEAARRDGTTEHCMLCSHNRPAQQHQVAWHGLHSWQVLVNPYPIVEGHYTIASATHEPQRLDNEVVADMLQLANEFPGYVVTYNGPRCGASIPWHLHLQAMPLSNVPLGEVTINTAVIEELYNGVNFDNFTLPLPSIIVTARNSQLLIERVMRVIDCLPCDIPDAEPMFNAMAWVPSGRKSLLVMDSPLMVIVPRRRHRPSIFGTAPGQLLWSPGVIDLMGLITLPRREDFDNITPDIIRQVYAELSPDGDQWKEIHNRLTNNYQ